jgi:hypothetical protein
LARTGASHPVITTLFEKVKVNGMIGYRKLVSHEDSDSHRASLRTRKCQYLQLWWWLWLERRGKVECCKSQDIKERLCWNVTSLN